MSKLNARHAEHRGHATADSRPRVKTGSCLVLTFFRLSSLPSFWLSLPFLPSDWFVQLISKRTNFQYIPCYYAPTNFLLFLWGPSVFIGTYRLIFSFPSRFPTGHSTSSCIRFLQNSLLLWDLNDVPLSDLMRYGIPNKIVRHTKTFPVFCLRGHVLCIHPLLLLTDTSDCFFELRASFNSPAKTTEKSPYGLSSI